jgi:putative endonuclease
LINLANTSKKIGLYAENYAYHYLKTQGLSLITRNYTCRFGEIDLIMQDKGTLVFIEVRYRQGHHFGHSLETVHLGKQSKLIKTAEYYLQSHASSEESSACRFDVLGISTSNPKPFKFPTSQRYPAQVEWVKNAFSR